MAAVKVVSASDERLQAIADGMADRLAESVGTVTGFVIAAQVLGRLMVATILEGDRELNTAETQRVIEEVVRAVLETVEHWVEAHPQADHKERVH